MEDYEPVEEEEEEEKEPDEFEEQKERENTKGHFPSDTMRSKQSLAHPSTKQLSTKQSL